jgi:predicted DNA-binding transcriptional regulator YafY
MRRAERLFRLVDEMRTRQVSRADDLAAQLEVSVRTVYRDIAHLQASGLPIDGEAGVGYVLRPGFEWPAVTFTTAQVEALAVGLAFAESLDDPELASAAREVRARIQANMPDPGARKLANAPYFSLRRRTGAPHHAALIRSAIRQRQIVSLIYEDGGKQKTTRHVQPLAIWSFDTGWMFSAWCEFRKDFRTFRFDRIARVAFTGESFPADETKGLRAFLDRERCDMP